MNKFTKIDGLIILIFGVILASAGYYYAWLDKVGRYEELSLLFPIYLILQTPVFLIGMNIPNFLFLPITFIWWFLLGSFSGFLLIFFKNYFDDFYIE
jgi:hypothetical protein